MKNMIKILRIISIVAVSFTLFSCSEDAEPLESVSHPPEWNNPQADNFHGVKVLAAGAESCQPCHGVNYQGGESVVACSDCHANYPHPAQWVGFGQPMSHDTYIAGRNWSMTECKSCHGNNYLGGSSQVSCAQVGCHVQTGGPEACNNCHGESSRSVAVLSSWAPPEDLNGNISTSAIGVGAHQTHLIDTTWSTAYVQDCGLCHREPTSFDDQNHIDLDPGRNINFGLEATNVDDVDPEWDSGEASCENVYCHGNFRFLASESSNPWAYTDSVIVGNNPEMIWTRVDGTQDACGTCHGLPPQGHLNVPTCSSCHSSVVDANNNIIDKSKHINLQIDLD